jgi:uncharacterized membrane protein YidH (DUF202 family)
MAQGRDEAAAQVDPAFPSISTGRFDEIPAPPMPVVDPDHAEVASTQYSRYRTKLSTHRTGLSEHRTGLSVNRTEMSSRRTGMSFQRTRMSADRTLMSIIRTSLSMISFGFTIYQVFKGLAANGVVAHGDQAARFFGQALVFLGVLLITVGIAYHVQFMLGLRRERATMKGGELVHAESVFPVSITLIVAILLLLLGLGALAGIVLHLGPFG